MKNILVLGASGMLGGEAVEYFNSMQGYKATGLSRDPGSDFRETVRSYLERGIYDWCVNCAAMTDTAGAQDVLYKRMLSLKANAMFPAEIARMCREYDVRLLHFSTDYVFSGEPANFPISDMAKPSPIGVYGTHKAIGENEALAQNSGATAVLRTSWLYGKRHEKSFVHRFSRALVQALAAGKTLSAPDDEVSLPTSTKALLRMSRLVIDQDLRGIMHATTLPHGGLLPCNQVPSRLRWAREIGFILHTGWTKRKKLGVTTPAEDLIWGKYDAMSSITEKQGGETDEWRPSYSAMLVSESLRGVSEDWIEDLHGFFADNGYGEEWSRKICEEAVEAIGGTA